MKHLGAIAGGMAALTVLAASLPAAAQSRYYDNRYDNSRNNGGDVVAGVVIGAIAGGLLAAAASDNDGRDGCGYYRDGRCWRNQGHWEREHGINSRYDYGRGRDYRYDRRDDRRDWRRDRRDDRRDYRYDRRW